MTTEKKKRYCLRCGAELEDDDLGDFCKMCEEEEDFEMHEEAF